MGSSFVHRLWQTRYEFPHLVYFTRHNLTRWLGRYGFEVIGHRYLQEVPNSTVINRLTTDHDISKPLAYLLAPACGCDQPPRGDAREIGLTRRARSAPRHVTGDEEQLVPSPPCASRRWFPRVSSHGRVS